MYLHVVFGIMMVVYQIWDHLLYGHYI